MGKASKKHGDRQRAVDKERGIANYEYGRDRHTSDVQEVIRDHPVSTVGGVINVIEGRSQQPKAQKSTSKRSKKHRKKKRHGGSKRGNDGRRGHRSNHQEETSEEEEDAESTDSSASESSSDNTSSDDSSDSGSSASEVPLHLHKKDTGETFIKPISETIPRRLRLGPEFVKKQQGRVAGKATQKQKEKVRKADTFGTSGNQLIYYPDPSALKDNRAIFSRDTNKSEPELHWMVRKGNVQQISLYEDANNDAILVAIQDAFGKRGPLGEFIFGKIQKGSCCVWPTAKPMEEVQNFESLKKYFNGCKYCFIFDVYNEDGPTQKQIRKKERWIAEFLEKKAELEQQFPTKKARGTAGSSGELTASVIHEDQDASEIVSLGNNVDDVPIVSRCRGPGCRYKASSTQMRHHEKDCSIFQKSCYQALRVSTDSDEKEDTSSGQDTSDAAESDEAGDVELKIKDGNSTTKQSNPKKKARKLRKSQKSHHKPRRIHHISDDEDQEVEIVAETVPNGSRRHVLAMKRAVIRRIEAKVIDAGDELDVENFEAYANYYLDDPYEWKPYVFSDTAVDSRLSPVQSRLPAEKSTVAQGPAAAPDQDDHQVLTTERDSQDGAVAQDQNTAGEDSQTGDANRPPVLMMNVDLASTELTDSGKATTSTAANTTASLGTNPLKMSLPGGRKRNREEADSEGQSGDPDGDVKRYE